ncbi:LuxR C-terminal-related transcriptional regulator [Paenibacillus sp. TH7-28]
MMKPVKILDFAEVSAEPPMLRTKITPPALRGNLIPRDRLTAAIEAGTSGRLTVVRAPAGFGKTTLLAQWAHASEHLCAWVALDERDNDPVRFWRYIAGSIASAVSGRQGARIRRLAASMPGLSRDAFLDALLNELFELPKALTLALDDLHAITDQGIHDGLSYFIEYLPPGVHVLTATRTELPFSAIKWKAQGQSAEIAIPELQFTSEEAERYFRQAAGSASTLRELSLEQIQRLAERTEGWIAGMQLFALSLNSRPEGTNFPADFRDNPRHIADYLFHEVVSRLPEGIYPFLLKTSILSRLDAAVCDAVTKQGGSREKLEALQQLNLFIVPLSGSQTWFRYHHLFARFLQEQLRRNDPAEWSGLHRRAAEYFAGQGDMDEAIDHAVSAEDFSLAAAYLERHVKAVMERGEFRTLLRWFGCFPGEDSLPLELALVYAFVRALTGDLPGAERMLGRIEQACGGVEVSEARGKLQSGILFVRSNLVFLSGDFGKWLASGRGILEGRLPDNPLYYNFDYNKQEPLVRRTPMGLNGVLSKDTEAIGLLFTGMLDARGWKDSLINLYVKQSLCEGYYEWNRLEESRRLLAEVGQAIAGRNIAGLLIPNRIMAVRLYAAEGKFELAHVTIDEAADGLDPPQRELWLPVLRALRCRVFLQEGKLAEVKKELARLDISAKDKPTYNKEFQYISLVRLLARQRKEEEALRLLELLKPQAERERQLSGIVEITLLQALAEFKLGRRTNSLSRLHETLALGEQNGYIRSFLDEGPEMLRLLKAYRSSRSGHQDEEGTPEGGGGGLVSDGYIEALICRFPDGDAAADSRKPGASLVEPPSRSELELLELLRQGAANKQIAQTLGLSEGTVRVYLSRLYGKLNVSSRTQALAAAQELRLLEE